MRQWVVPLVWVLASGLGLASLAMAVWGMAWVLGLGGLGVALVFLGFRLERAVPTSRPRFSPVQPLRAPTSEPGFTVRARVIVRAPASSPLSEAEVARLLAELRPAPRKVLPAEFQPPSKMPKRYRRLREAGVQPLFDLETLEVA